MFPNPKSLNKLSFKCFKCGHSDSMSGMLKHLDENIYREYRRSLFSANSYDFSGPTIKEIPPEMESKKVMMHPSNFFVPLTGLSENHPARLYINSRGISLDMFKYIWYTDTFWKNIQQLKPDQKVRSDHDEGRVIFPIMDPTNTYMVALQGRSLDPDAKLRYVDCQIMKGEPRLFGQERINRHSPVIVLEGPVDSFFVENSVALCGATKNPEGLPEDRIFYLDQEPRNPNIMERYKSLIESGEKIIMLPDEFLEHDANDIFKIKGWNRSEFREFILNHVKSGLRAKLKLAEWMRLCPNKKERK